MRTAGRIDAIDAARGCAMLLVCFSHVRYHFDPDSALHVFLTYVTRIATPTFLLLSGFVAGHLLRSDPSQRGSVSLVDRGLFLLLVAHLLLGLADLPRVSTVDWIFARASIPDAIGVSLCLAVLFRRASFGALMSIGITLCLLSWFIALVWDPQAQWAAVAGRLLFNVQTQSTWLSDTSIVPYFGTFLLGMALSLHLHEKVVRARDDLIGRRLLAIGATTIALALLGVLAWHLAKHSLPAFLQEPYISSLLRQTLDPRHKWPPSPAYLLFYGGIGLLMAGIYFIGKPSKLVSPIVRHASVIGRASLMCFVLQDWLLLLAPQLFGFAEIRSTAFWLVYVFAVIGALYFAATLWGRVHGNRFFTIGLRTLYRRRTHAPAGIGVQARESAPR
jgi:uncharacterized membrane protein